MGKCLGLSLVVVALLTSFCVGQESDEEIRDRLWLKRLGPHSTTRFVAGRWAGIGIEVANPNDQPVELSTSTFSFDFDDRRFGRRIWVPSRSLLRTSHPILVPRSLAPRKVVPNTISNRTKHLELKSWLYDETNGNKVPIQRRTGERQFVDTVPLNHGKYLTGVIQDREDRALLPNVPYEALVAFLVEAGRSRSTYAFVPISWPTAPEMLDPYETLLIAGNDFASDTLTIHAIRQWVIRGGRLWIMLDQVEASTVQTLLGEAYQAAEIDRIYVNQVDLVPADANTSSMENLSHFFETPVEMVRVQTHDSRVSYTVDGWPALFWLSLGRGQVMVTTLEARSWLAERPASREQSSPLYNTSFVVTDPLKRMTTRFYNEVDSPIEIPEALHSYSAQQIGYEILPRTSLFVVLGGFSLLLGLAGIALARYRQLRHMAWISPIVAVTLSIGMFTLGETTRKSVPSTEVHAQIVQLSSHEDEAYIKGSMATYLPHAEQVSFAGRHDAVLLSDESDSAAAETIWHDSGRWRVDRPIGPGTSQWGYTTFAQLSRPVVGVARLEDNMLKGSVTSPDLTDLGDPVFVSRHGLLGGSMNSQGEFSVDPASELSTSEFFVDTILDSEQQRRNDVLSELLGGTGSLATFEQPTLFFWARALPSGIETTNTARQVEWALFSLPLDFEAAAEGAQVTLTFPMLAMETRSRSGGRAVLYDRRKREWMELSQQGQFTLAFKIPSHALPLRLDSAVAEFDVSSQHRQMSWLSQPDLPNEERVAEISNSAGRVRIELTEPEQLKLNSSGELEIGVNVGPFTGSGEMTPWRIERVKITLRGEKLAP